MLASPWMTAEANPTEMSGCGGGRRRAWILTSSVLLHGAVLATLAAVQLWRVEAVAEPPVADVFQVQLPMPPLPAAPPAERSERSRQEAQKPPQQTPTQPHFKMVAQPELASIPEKVPGPALVPLPPDPPLTAASDADRSREDAGGGGRSAGDRSAGPACAGCGGFGDERVLPVGGPISRPRIVPGTRVQPRYTEMARTARLQGVAVLRAVIDERGNVIELRVVKDLPFGLGDEAVKAVGQWKFTPALLAGLPVKVFFEVTVQFEIR
jgi:protein TonB